MPAILREDGFVVRIYGPPREHPPPHVHVERGRESTVVIRLGTTGSPMSVWAVCGMRDHDVVRALGIVAQHHEELRHNWRTIHGEVDTD